MGGAVKLHTEYPIWLHTDYTTGDREGRERAKREERGKERKREEKITEIDQRPAKIPWAEFKGLKNCRSRVGALVKSMII